jgi:hypothetical protein
MKFWKGTLRALLVCCLCIATHRASASEDPHMSPEEKAKAVKWMNESHAETLKWLGELSDEQLAFKAAPEKWSVLEVAEHIWMAEGRLFGAMEQALKAAANPEWETKTKGKSEFLADVMIHRKGKANAPEEIVPSGKLSRAEVIAKLKEARARTLQFTETTALPLKAHTLDHPFPVFNTLNAYQWLIYIPLHNFRHNRQIEEVMANPNFPKSEKKVRPRP